MNLMYVVPCFHVLVSILSVAPTSGQGNPRAAWAVNPVAYIGPSGPTGATGQKGRKGIKGYRGRPGATGEKGNDPPGLRIGPKGEKGQPGLPGVNGFAPVGATGPKGKKGQKGVRGYTGLKGDPGITGVLGATGATGAKGDMGMKGAPYSYTFAQDSLFLAFEDSNKGPDDVYLNHRQATIICLCAFTVAELMVFLVRCVALKCLRRRKNKAREKSTAEGSVYRPVRQGTCPE